MNGFVGEARHFGLIRCGERDKGERFGVVILFGFLRESFQLEISALGHSQALIYVKYVVPLGERDLEGLAEHWARGKRAETRRRRQRVAVRVALRMGISLAKSSLAEETVRRWLPGRISASMACFARTPAPPTAQTEPTNSLPRD